MTLRHRAAGFNSDHAGRQLRNLWIRRKAFPAGPAALSVLGLEAVMLDSFTVMHKGGAVLWEKALTSIKGNPVNELIRTVLLEERSGETNARIDMHLLKWALVNEFDLIFVVCEKSNNDLPFCLLVPSEVSEICVDHT